MLCVLQYLLPSQARSVVIYSPSRADPCEQVLCCCMQVVTRDAGSVVIYNSSAATRVSFTASSWPDGQDMRKALVVRSAVNSKVCGKLQHFDVDTGYTYCV